MWSEAGLCGAVGRLAPSKDATQPPMIRGDTGSAMYTLTSGFFRCSHDGSCPMGVSYNVMVVGCMCDADGRAAALLATPCCI